MVVAEWRIRDYEDPVDEQEAYSKFPNMFSLKIHHGGYFTESPGHNKRTCKQPSASVGGSQSSTVGGSKSSQVGGSQSSKKASNNASFGGSKSSKVGGSQSSKKASQSASAKGKQVKK